MADTPDFTIRIGTTFPGAAITCWADTGKTTPFQLAGYSAFAEIRNDANSPVLIDLLPEIEANDDAGLITIPAIDYADTMDLPEGEFVWDIILEKDGVRSALVVTLTAAIVRPTTQPPIPVPE